MDPIFNKQLFGASRKPFDDGFPEWCVAATKHNLAQVLTTLLSSSRSYGY
jgi:hypothetical protein